jgi:hypothetical protein
MNSFVGARTLEIHQIALDIPFDENLTHCAFRIFRIFGKFNCVVYTFLLPIRFIWIFCSECIDSRINYVYA